MPSDGLQGEQDMQAAAALSARVTVSAATPFGFSLVDLTDETISSFLLVL